MINYSEARESVKLALEAGSVPVIMGEAGIGKSAMMKSIANEQNLELFTIEGNLLKSGEVTGLPVASGSREERLDSLLKSKGIMLKQYSTEEVLAMHAPYIEFNLTKDTLSNEELVEQTVKFAKTGIALRDKKNALEIVSYENKRRELMYTVPDLTLEYAPFGLLTRVNEYLESCEDESRGVLLFVDELNRSTHEVMQELMNVILNREINGYVLNKRVKLAAAVNPSSTWSEFKDSDYQVTEPDPAQKDRMTWLFVDVDVKNWLGWATDFNDKGESNIHEDVIDFISTYPDFLHIPDYKSTDDVTPTPRSWERVSKTLTAFGKGRYGQGALNALIYGDVGITSGVQFIKFIEERTNPLLKPSEIFLPKITELTEEVVTRFKDEAPTRKLAILKSCLKHLSTEKKIKDEHCMMYTNLILMTTADIRLGVMQDTFLNYRNIHKALTKKEEYLNAFHDLNKLTTSI